MNRRLLPMILTPLTHHLVPMSLIRTLSLTVRHCLLPTKDNSLSQSDSESSTVDSPLDAAARPGSTSTSTSTLGESGQLPVVGPYDLGSLKTSLLRVTLSHHDKYNVLNHLDQPQQYKFPLSSHSWQSAVVKISQILVFKVPLVA